MSTTHPAHDAVVDLLRRDLDQAEYDEIRELWKAHSIAEDNRDLPGLIATLTDDCVYELVQTGDRWEGHEGAARFYTQLLTAFPDEIARVSRDFELRALRVGEPVRGASASAAAAARPAPP